MANIGILTEALVKRPNHVCGDGYNLGSNLTYMLDGWSDQVQIYVISGVGDDAYGGMIRADAGMISKKYPHFIPYMFKFLGTETGNFKQFPGEFDEQGRPRVEYNRAGAAASRIPAVPFSNLLNWVVKPDIMHVSGIYAGLGDGAWENCLAAIAYTQKTGAILSFDVNYRFHVHEEITHLNDSRDRLQKIAYSADVIKTGRDEAIHLLGAPQEEADSIAEYLQQEFGGAIFVTDDVNDASLAVEAAFSSEPLIFHQRIFNGRSENPAGAGDGFMAGILMQLALYCTDIHEPWEVDQHLRSFGEKTLRFARQVASLAFSSPYDHIVVLDEEDKKQF